MVILLQQKNFGPNVIYFALEITEGRGAIGPLICPNTHRGKKFRGRLFAYPQEASPELFSPVRPTSFLFDSSSITIKTIAHMAFIGLEPFAGALRVVICAVSRVRWCLSWNAA